MRQRLRRATLESLAEVGYAGSTLSGIVRRAGVSRGAQVHHYPHKQALFLDATESMIRRSYARLGQILLSANQAEDRLDAVLDQLENEILNGSTFRVYQELLSASQHDPELATSLTEMIQRMRELFRHAALHYFSPSTPDDPEPGLHFERLAVLLFGLSCHRHMLHPKELKQLTSSWAAVVRPRIKAREHVNAPPPALDAMALAARV